MHPQSGRSGPWKWLTLILFLALVMGGGTLIGVSVPPGAWYAGLDKPWFNPPNWIFAPVWSTLYVLIAIAGWRTWRRAPTGLSMQVWFAQLACNFAWTPVFFGMHMPGLALVILAAMLALIVLFARLQCTPDRVSALLFVPYAAWVCFAGLLNLSIWWLNGQ
ncbi:TspO/MBR family protein [Oricola sp.]|uniref:TspO/MBR family protein n=1 Tax=Oricola sp. TaxID=1979950 RepID=UPI0025FCC1F6|nr:TspO/MBR family protein [Oricola sp.]MCI5075323.1 tryptophan-rich sensory protein [Oricola sp.]